MNKVKVLHCADLHFDTPFKELSKEVSDTSKNELLEVFKNIIDLAIDENIEVLLIAGDVFDNLTVNKNTLFFISDQIRRIKNIKVFISPGNHDPYNEKSFYSMINWPENVYIFKGDMEFKEVKELNLIVWGAGFRNNYENKTLLRRINIDNDKINIMLLHGEITSSNSKNEYNPIYINDIYNSNIDYIALGHRHKFSGILKEGMTTYAYSGCPQGRGFDEEGEKGVIIGEVYKGGTNLEFFPVYKRKYVTKEIDITDTNNYDEVVFKVLSDLSDEEIHKNFYKIILKGELKEHFKLKENLLIDKLKNKFYYFKIINDTSIEVNLEELSKDYSIKGKFIAKIIEKLKEASDDDKEILKLALKIGIQCLSEDEVNLNDY
ncbi:DNA repair exonuclease [uncultured Clostridium sp.]|uniref:metallophosphoesterase family protein n=1 Tax=uncultured Clostridium sp. TaxID=59620 RepID=UPI0025E6B7A7|nr:DNA repair exonuclease [uncultured Clostridium sp.]MDU4882771.1 DNA repair exonuclease [Clostridium celatum]MDU7075959.1 DNA repair exonuclease [Clostridium celatum]